MKPWFVLIVLWALSGIVTLRQVYSDGSHVEPRREPVAAAEEQAYVF
ncbi:MAG: hypothetical protein QM784_28390 [Polyangiaceae bacterium]